MKKILASCTSQMELRVLTELEDEGEVAVLGVATWFEDSLANFQLGIGSKTVFRHSDVMSWSKNPSHNGHQTTYKFDLEDLLSFQPYERDYYFMLNRSDTLSNMKFGEMRESFIFAVEYWMGVVLDLQPDIVYFSGTPHEASDFVLFACCEVTGIETLMWQELPLIDGKMLTRNWRGSWSSQLSGLPSNTVTVIPEEFVKSYRTNYENAEPAYNKVAKHDISVLSKKGWSLAKFSRFLLLAKYGLSGIFSNWRRNVANSKRLYGLSTVNSVLWTSLQKSLNTLHMIKVAAEVRIAKQSLATISSTRLPEEKYVVFFLHYEPELTVVPMGDVGGDQYIAIASLVKHLPKGWKVVVKEHPAQFAPSFAGYFTGRNKDFYKRILGIGRVEFASSESDTFELIDNCEFVSTLSGTVGWEAVIRGKPVLVFGNAWYSEAPGVYVCKSSESLQNFIMELTSGQSGELEIASQEEITNYVNELFLQFDKIVLDPETAKLNGTDWDSKGSSQNLKERLRGAFRDI
jgi:hypothetical protein